MSVPSKAQVKYTYEQKWGNEDPFGKSGYAQIPVLLLEHGARLLIEPDEAYLIIQIWRFKWTPSDEGPSEKKLAEAVGKSDDTVRKLLNRLVAKGFLRVQRKGGDFGYYTHTIYNFDTLRALLNECHYKLHPEERPVGKRAIPLPEKKTTTTQLRGVVKQQQATLESTGVLPAKDDEGSPQSCGTLIKSLDLNKKEKGSLALSEQSQETNKHGAAMLKAALVAAQKASR